MDDYINLIGKYIENPDLIPFPAVALFNCFDNEDYLIEEIHDLLTDGEIESNFFPGILNTILTTWQEDNEIHDRFTNLPEQLWTILMSFINGNLTPKEKSKSIHRIEEILGEQIEKSDICLDLLRQMISTDKLYNQLDCIKNSVLPNLTSRLERECYYIKDDKHPQIQMRANQVHGAKILLSNENEDVGTTETIISSTREKVESESLFHDWSDWYNAFQKRYQEITGKMLQISEEQRLAIETDDVQNTLVCSSAGSGKTTLLVTRFFYLVECKHIAPEKILILAYTNDVREEINTLIYSLWGKEIDFPSSWDTKNKNRPALTFHKLALGLIESIIKGKPQIFDDVSEAYSTRLAGDQKKTLLLADVPDFIKGLGNIVSQYEVSCRNMLRHVKTPLTTYAAPYKDSAGRYCCVRSTVEKQIFIYLAQHNVKFYYEKKFPKKEWFPDFTLEDRKGETWVYEHFTVDPYDEERGQEWKRYQKNAKEKIGYYTRVLDGRFFYTYGNAPTPPPKSNGDCRLKELLKKHDIKFDERNLTYPTSDEKTSFYESLKYLQLFFDVRKVVLDETAEIDKISDKLRYSNSTELTEEKHFWMNLFLPLNTRYSDLIGKEKTMYTDFTHCMVWAKELVDSKDLPEEYSFDYVLIDEYQDISKSRFSLLLSMRKKHDFNMFAVGDDWQSIYGFTNSCLDLFSHFPEHTDDGYMIMNVQTYRFGNPLATVSSKLVLDQLTTAGNNDNRENSSLIRKIVKGAPHETSLSGVMYIPQADRKSELQKQVKMTINVIYNRIPKEFFEEEDNKKERIGILCRFRDDVSTVIKLLKDKIKDESVRDRIDVYTTHASKGLTFKYVFLFSVNNETDYPFIYPDETRLIQLIKNEDEPVKQEDEERRLFYVALTRAKSEVFLLHDSQNPSPYATELSDNQSISYIELEEQ